MGSIFADLLSRIQKSHKSTFDGDKPPEIDIEKLNFKNLLDQYEHRIITLEAEYFEDQKQGRVNLHKMHSRGAKINRLKKRLSEFKSYHFNAESQAAHDIGFPRIFDFNSEDQKIFNEFLNAQTASIQLLQNQIDLIDRWSQQAASGSTSIFRIMIRLPRIGRMIRKTEALTQEANAKDTLLNKHLEETLEKFRTYHGTSTSSSLSPMILKAPIFDRLAFWFGRIEKQITRVAKLKIEFKHQTITIKNMENWLPIMGSKNSISLKKRSPLSLI